MAIPSETLYEGHALELLHAERWRLKAQTERDRASLVQADLQAAQLREDLETCAAAISDIERALKHMGSPLRDGHGWRGI